MSRWPWFALALGVAPLAALAQSNTLAPGQWQISVQTQAAGMPMPMAPVEVSQCLSEHDAQDPSKILGAVSSPEASNCVYADKGYEGANFHFSMQCSGTLALQAHGRFAFTATSLNGTIDATASIGGQPVELSNVVTAQRVGDCRTPG